MQYIALKELDLDGGRKAMPGDYVPEAANWDRVWFSTGHVGAYPDDMAEHVVQQFKSGHIEAIGTHAFGQHHLGLAISEARAQGGDGPKPTSKTDEPPRPAPALDIGEPPPGKERITADAGDPPTELEPSEEPEATPSDGRRARRRTRS